MPLKTSDHTNIHKTHLTRPQSLQAYCSKRQEFTVVPKPSRRYLKSLALSYVHCPDCESQDIIYHGYSSKGTQKHLCKSCGHQFVLGFDAVFPRSQRHRIFDEEFMSNLKPTGFQEGCGRQSYWVGARFLVLNQLESQAIKVRFNKIMKTITIQGEREYRLLLEFIVDEAYVHVTD